MDAADVANFAKPADLPSLVGLLGSSDEGERYWGVIGCIQLGKQAAIPEVLSIMRKLIQTDPKDERTLEVRVTAALYLCRIEHRKEEALRSFAEVIASAPQGSPAKRRAWANLFLLNSEAKDVTGMLKAMRLDKNDQETLSLFQSRLE